MSTKVADIYAEVGFKFDQVKLREVAKYIGDINIASIISATSLTALGLGIKDLVEQTSALSNNLNILSTTTGVDPQFIQKMEHAAYVLGSSKQAADQWISSVSSWQAKLSLAQSDQRFFSLSQILGVDAVGYKTLIGDTEKLIPAVQKALSKVWSPSDRMSREQFARTKTYLASLINVPPDLLTAFQNKDFQTIFNSFQGLTNTDINQTNSAMRKWRDSIDDLNTEFSKLSIVVIPLVDLMSQAIKKISGFINAGDPRNFPKPAFAHGTARTQGATGGFRSSPEEVAANDRFWKEFWSGKSNIPAKQQNVTVNVAPITIKTDSPQEFGKKFQEEFTKALDIATRQSPLGQT